MQEFKAHECIEFLLPTKQNGKVRFAFTKRLRRHPRHGSQLHGYHRIECKDHPVLRRENQGEKAGEGTGYPDQKADRSYLL